MKRIDLPYFTKYFREARGSRHLDGYKKKDFEDWFNEHIEPLNKLLDSAVEVIQDPADFSWWRRSDDTNVKVPVSTSRAYLIGIELIKQESCADVLRDMISNVGSNGENYLDFKVVFARAQAALSRESKDD